MLDIIRKVQDKLDTSKVCPICFSAGVDFERGADGEYTCMLTCRDCGYYGEDA